MSKYKVKRADHHAWPQPTLMLQQAIAVLGAQAKEHYGADARGSRRDS